MSWKGANGGAAGLVLEDAVGRLEAEAAGRVVLDDEDEERAVIERC